MGINFRSETYEEFTPSWSYSGFNRFREKLAKQIGLDLREMIGFGGEIPWTVLRIR